VLGFIRDAASIVDRRTSFLLDMTAEAALRALDELNRAGDALGHGVPTDRVSALEWYSIAAARATGDERQGIADSRDSLAKRLAPQQVAEAQKRASEWLTAFETRSK
jgi:hypothetical protein